MLYIGPVSTAIPIIIEGQFQVFKRFSSSNLVLKTVESCFAALNYYEIGSNENIEETKSAKTFQYVPLFC